MKNIILFFLVSLVAPTYSGFNYSEIYHFENVTSGGGPLGTLLLANNGNLYGTAVGGGLYQCGTAFVINPYDDNVTVIHHFDCSNGSYPFAPLIEGPDGTIFGATQAGGKNDKGTIFRIDHSHAVQPWYHFSGGSDGNNPSAVQIDDDGYIIGLTGQGGKGHAGTIFRLDYAGNLETIHHFNATTEGSFPLALTRPLDGKFYGVTERGAKIDGSQGSLFAIDSQGGFDLLYSFAKGHYDYASLPIGLITGDESSLYGTSLYGVVGRNEVDGVIYKANTSVPNAPQPQVQVLNSVFNSGLIGLYGGLTLASNGYLYGTAAHTILACGALYKINATGETGTPVIILHTFTIGEPGEPIGCFPKTPPIEVSPGVFYGITYGDTDFENNAGVIYKFTDT